MVRARRGPRFETGRGRNSAAAQAVKGKKSHQAQQQKVKRQPKPGPVQVTAYTPGETGEPQPEGSKPSPAQNQPRSQQPERWTGRKPGKGFYLPIAEGLEVSDLDRLERAAARQLERNRKRLNGLI